MKTGTICMLHTTLDQVRECICNFHYSFNTEKRAHTWRVFYPMDWWRKGQLTFDGDRGSRSGGISNTLGTGP